MTDVIDVSTLASDREKLLDIVKKIYNSNGEVWLGRIIKEMDPTWKSKWDLIREEEESYGRHNS